MGGDYWIDDAHQIWTVGLACSEDGALTGAEVYRHDGEGWRQMGSPFEDANWFPAFVDVPEGIRIEVYGWYDWDGTAWQSVERPGYPQDLPIDTRGVFDGHAYMAVPRFLGCSSGYRLRDGQSFCFDQGQVYLFDGSDWTTTFSDPFAETQPASTWGTIPPTLWAGADTEIAWGTGPDGVVFRARATNRDLEQFTGSGWETRPVTGVFDIDGNGPNDVWIGTFDGPYHYDGQALERERPFGDDSWVRDVHALGDGITAIATREAVYRYDGEWSVLQDVPPGWEVAGVAGTGPRDIWLVLARISRSPAAELLHYDGVAWSVSELEDGASGPLATGPDGVTWMRRRYDAVRLDTMEETLAPSFETLWSNFWVGPDALWDTSPTQSLRLDLPPSDSP